MGLKNAVVDDTKTLRDAFCSRKMMCCIFLAILIHGFSHIEIHAALIYIHSIMSRGSVHGVQWPNTAPTK